MAGRIGCCTIVRVPVALNPRDACASRIFSVGFGGRPRFGASGASFAEVAPLGLLV